LLGFCCQIQPFEAWKQSASHFQTKSPDPGIPAISQQFPNHYAVLAVITNGNRKLQKTCRIWSRLPLESSPCRCMVDFAAFHSQLDRLSQRRKSVGVILAGSFWSRAGTPVRVGCPPIPENRYRFANRQGQPSPIPRKRSFFAGYNIPGEGGREHDPSIALGARATDSPLFVCLWPIAGNPRKGESPAASRAILAGVGSGAAADDDVSAVASPLRSAAAGASPGILSINRSQPCQADLERPSLLPSRTHHSHSANDGSGGTHHLLPPLLSSTYILKGKPVGRGCASPREGWTPVQPTRGLCLVARGSRQRERVSEEPLAVGGFPCW